MAVCRKRRSNAHTPDASEGTIEELKKLLTESGYFSGFPVFREITQNAIDAGAAHVSAIELGADGFGEGRDAFRRPGLIFINDGVTTEDDDYGLRTSSNPHKRSDGGRIGKFGLGLKSIFHYCDVFYWAAFDKSGALTFHSVANPYCYTDRKGVPVYPAAYAWEQEDNPSADTDLLRKAATALGYSKQAFVLWAPFRSKEFCPDPGVGLREPLVLSPGEALDSFESPGGIASLLALSQIESVTLAAGFKGPRRVYGVSGMGGNAAPRASRKGQHISEATVSGIVTRAVGAEKPETVARFYGVERLAADDPELLAQRPDLPNETAPEPFGSCVVLATGRSGKDGTALCVLPSRR